VLLIVCTIVAAHCQDTTKGKKYKKPSSSKSQKTISQEAEKTTVAKATNAKNPKATTGTKAIFPAPKTRKPEIIPKKMPLLWVK